MTNAGGELEMQVIDTRSRGAVSTTDRYLLR